MESAAYGCAAITSDRGGLSETFNNNLVLKNLNKYIEKFGIYNGISKFAETFKLVYILKSKEDVLRETGIELSKLVINDIKQSEQLW